VIEIRDVSAGLVINGNHFIVLVYDERDAVGLEPSERPSIWRTRTMFGAMSFPRGKRLYGHFLEWMNLNSTEIQAIHPMSRCRLWVRLGRANQERARPLFTP
jgi:hypothetical protein